MVHFMSGFRFILFILVKKCVNYFEMVSQWLFLPHSTLMLPIEAALF